MLNTNVIEVNVLSGNKNLSSHDGVLYNKDGTILIACPGGKTTVEVYESCTEIDIEAFYKSKVNSVKLNEGIKTLGFRAFGSCSQLTSINLPKSIQQISGYCFSFCNKLVINANLGRSLVYVYGNSFKWTIISKLDMSECTSLYTIQDTAFQNCKITSIILPPFLKELQNNVFESSSLSSIELPSSLETVGMDCFTKCTELKSFSFVGTNVIKISSSCFEGSGLVEITISSSIETVDQNAFKDCTNLTKLIYENNPSLKSISSGVISGCSSLISITIPPSVEEISEGAFANANSLLEFVAEGNRKYSTIGGVLFLNNGANLFAFPGGKTEAIISKEVVEITKLGFANCINLVRIVFEKRSTIKTLQANVFLGCSGLKYITLPGSLESFDSSTFADCTNIISITFADSSSLESIPANAFANCKKMTDFGFQYIKSLKYIGSSSFEGCTLLKSVVFHNTITIGTKSFYGCNSIRSVILPSTIKSVGVDAFASCDSLNTFSYCGKEIIEVRIFTGSTKVTAVYVKSDYQNKSFGGIGVYPILDDDCMYPTQPFTFNESGGFVGWLFLHSQISRDEE